MRSYIADIMYDRRKDFASLPLRVVLRILSVIYSLVISVKNYLYDKRVFKTNDVPCRVVSIGNLTVGGTGKTPAAIMTAKLLMAEGYKVAVVSRGYGRKEKTPLVVSDGVKILATPAESGDEPYIIASSVTGVPVVVGADRYRAAELAFQRFRPDVIVLDDAFQHRRLYRNADIVTLDAGDPYGNDYLLPRGILRESPWSLSRAKAVIITRYHEDMHREKIERMVKYYNRNVPIFFSKHVPKALRIPFSVQCRDPEFIRDKKIAALSNIACPSSFRQTLVSLGGDVAVHHSMDDHHRYTAQELNRLEREIPDSGADILVMTAKDERNLPDSYRFKTVPAFVLDIEASITEQKEEYLKIVEPQKLRKK